MPKDIPACDGLDIPAFLKRGGPKLTNEQARNLSGGTRSWAPFRAQTNIRPTVSAALFERPNLPVVVGVRRGDGSRATLARYDNFEAFAAAHDPVGLPICRVACGDDETYVLTIAKPWTQHYKAPDAEPKKVNGSRSKAAIISELLQRPEGCTTKDVLTATGWPSVSMPAQARTVGLALTKEKRDGAIRYFGKRP